MRKPWRSNLLLMMSFALVSCGNEPPPSTLKYVRDGNKSLLAQNAQEAMDNYIAALSDDPFRPELHLNLGLSFEFLQQADKALQSYQEAERLAEQQGNLEVLFMARFNRAQLLAKAKRVDEALASYQKALEISPNSKETKTNIELLTRQQQGGGGGEGEPQDKKDQQDQKQQQNQNKKGQDPKDSQRPQDGDKKDKESAPKQSSPKYQPRPYQGKELNEGDVKKILGEIKQQEQRIRAEYNRKDVKEQPRDKDW